ncbi:MAG: glycerol-3-phosphate 1-O-acyltransferase PlsY [Bacteroidetes bacterium]|nr:glycerol-3-phosphate 1-O-acyltransferase PlsY [Bacteroidota bacterium]
MINLFLVLVFSYLIGSISPSILLSRWIKGVDIRTYGSGNAGMTNAIRLLGSKWGSVVALVDLVKGLFCTLILAPFLMTGIHMPGVDDILVRILAGVAAVAGHIWTVFFGFRGGKGVLTMAGSVLGVAPLPVAICLAVFLVIFAVFRYVSLGSIVGAIAFPVTVYVKRFYLAEPVSPHLLWFSLFVAALIAYTHRENIGRLLRGEEKKFGSPNSPKTP